MNVKNFDELYPNRFLKAGLVIDKPTFTIKDVNVEELESGDGKAQKKGVVKFNETEMELTLNKTNGLCIAEMFGKDIARWIGKRITLCSEIDNFGRDKVDAIRVYGSPDITEQKKVMIQLPKRKPKERILYATAQTQKPAPKEKQDFIIEDEFGIDTDQTTKFIQFANLKGWEAAEKALISGYNITQEQIEQLKNKVAL